MKICGHFFANQVGDNHCLMTDKATMIYKLQMINCNGERIDPALWSFILSHAASGSAQTDCTEEDSGDHSAGQTAGAEAPAGCRRVTATLQVTNRAASAGTSQ